MDTRTLHIVEAAATHVVSRMDLLNRLGGLDHYVRTILPSNMDALVIQIHSLFAADNIKNVEVRYPKDWWEALKERFAPSWFTRHSPVRYHITTVDIKAIWAGYQAPEGAKKWGPFLPYSLERTNELWED